MFGYIVEQPKLVCYTPSTRVLSLYAGYLLLSRIFNGDLLTDVYPFPPTGEEPTRSKQELTGSLAGFSLTCGSCPHGAVTRLSYPMESYRALVILADHVLSVVLVNETSSTVVQV